MNQKIGNAEYELGRYKKKVREQTEELRSLQRQVDDAMAGVKEVQKTVDAVIFTLVKQYGEKVRDEENGELVGYRLPVRYPFVLDDQWSIQCTKWPESDDLIIGLVKKMEA